jgi:hypothetical protein
MQATSYQVTIDGEVWTVTQDAFGRIFATSPKGSTEPAFIGSWNHATLN